jgi:hypothetical protein
MVERVLRTRFFLPSFSHLIGRVCHDHGEVDHVVPVPDAGPGYGPVGGDPGVVP